DDPHAVLGPIGQPSLDRLGFSRVERNRQMDLRRRGPLDIELLERGLKNLVLSAFALVRLRRGVAGGRQFDTLDNLAAANLKDLNDRAGRSRLDAERVAIAQLGPGHLLLSLLQRGNRAERIA